MRRAKSAFRTPAVRGVFVLIRDVRPNVENIRFGEWGTNVSHCQLAFRTKILRIGGWLANAAE
jgi:hypothetical protein